MPSTERRGEQRARAEREFAENERTSDALALLAWPCGSGPAELTRLMSPAEWPGTLASLRRHRTNLTIWRSRVTRGWSIHSGQKADLCGTSDFVRFGSICGHWP